MTQVVVAVVPTTEAEAAVVARVVSLTVKMLDLHRTIINPSFASLSMMVNLIPFHGSTNV